MRGERGLVDENVTGSKKRRSGKYQTRGGSL